MVLGTFDNAGYNLTFMDAVYQIVCDNDTLMLTIQTPPTTFGEKGWGDIVFDEPLF